MITTHAIELRGEPDAVDMSTSVEPQISALAAYAKALSRNATTRAHAVK